MTSQQSSKIDQELLDVCRQYADKISIFDAHDKIKKILRKHGYYTKLKGKTGEEAQKLKSLWINEHSDEIEKLAKKFGDYGT